jgi:hypothetical protein
MKEQISFMTSLFESGVAKQAAEGDRLLGEDLAVWLGSRPHDDEFVFDKPIQAGAGWTETVHVGGSDFMLGFNIVHASVGSDYSEWRITIDGGQKWKFFSSPSSTVRGRLCDHIHNVLRSERFVREIQWCD